jgi:hypothetical protein
MFRSGFSGGGFRFKPEEMMQTVMPGNLEHTANQIAPWGMEEVEVLLLNRELEMRESTL